jgi:hypothetical protein
MDDFRTLRRYTRSEAATALNLKQYLLRDWVAARRVPHQRTGRVRGVWFTHADLTWIGAHLTDLMHGRAPGELNADLKNDASDCHADLLGRFAGLRSCRT